MTNEDHFVYNPKKLPHITPSALVAPVAAAPAVPAPPGTTALPTYFEIKSYGITAYSNPSRKTAGEDRPRDIRYSMIFCPGPNADWGNVFANLTAADVLAFAKLFEAAKAIGQSVYFYWDDPSPVVGTVNVPR